MPNLRTETILAPEKSFLAFPDHYVNVVGKIAYSVLATFTTTDPAGNKALLAGQVVALAEDGTITKSAATTGNAVVFNTVKLDDYESIDEYVNVTVLVHGFVRKDRLKDAANLDAPLIHVIAQ